MTFELSNPSTVEVDGWATVSFTPANEGEIARALLAAAGDARVDSVFAQTGAFLVPADIAEAAGLGPAPAPTAAPADATPAAPADTAAADAAAADAAAASAKKSKAAADASATDAPAAS